MNETISYLKPGRGSPAPLGIFGAPGGIGTSRVVAGPPPVPLTTITQEDIHPQCFFHSEADPLPQRGLLTLHL